MSRINPLSLFIFCIYFLPGLLSAQDPSLHIDDRGARIEGLRPGAEVVWVTAGQQIHQGIPLFSAYTEAASDEDRDGSITWQPNPDLPLPKLSIWVAIDTRTGWIDIASPLGLEDRVRPFPLDQSSARDADRALIGQLPLGRVVIVRPGQGAWWLESMDGGNDDADRILNGSVELQLATARPLGQNAESFDRLRPQDRLIFIDHTTVQVAAQVGGANPQPLLGSDEAVDSNLEGR